MRMRRSAHVRPEKPPGRIALATGPTLAEVPRQTGIPRSTLSNWRRDLDRAIARTPSACPRCHGTEFDKCAYAYLLGGYLGDGAISRTRKGVYRLEIACGDDDWPGLIAEAAKAISGVMPRLSVGRAQKIGRTVVNAYSKHWPCCSHSTVRE
jgi:hypothetical protein